MVYPHENPLEIRFSIDTRQIDLPKGTYILEAYGASGGGDPSYCTTARNEIAGQCLYTDDEVDLNYKGNTRCFTQYSQPGAGAYAKGKLSLSSKTTIYVTTGGMGKYGAGEVEGGHNGGGKGYCHKTTPCSGSGGGATDFRVLNNSLFNRFLVAGAGGGSDDADDEGTPNDGSGGSGGLPGQGFWVSGNYRPEKETTTVSGYSFGFGQDYQRATYESAGAGSGFFGGVTEPDYNAGGSGGSSFALTEGANFPEGEIVVLDSSGAEFDRGVYALANKQEYYLTEVDFATGVWIGNGKARITYIPDCITCNSQYSKFVSMMTSLLFALVNCPGSN